MKLELESSSLQHSSDYYFFQKNTVEMTGDEIGNMLRTGVKLAQEGNRTDARYLLLRVTEADPENETAWLWLASISEYPEELLIFLQNVLKINSENERALEWSKATQSLLAKTFVQRGIDASHDGQMDFSKQCFLQAIYYDNENEMAWLWLASITQDVEEKILHLQKVLKFNPENETALSSLKVLTKESPQSLLRKANSAAISGDRETAGIMLEEVMEDAPQLEEAWILKAYLANDFYEKLGCYEKVLALNPQNEAAQAGMSSLRTLMDKVEPQFVTVQQTVESSNEFSNKETQKDSQPEENIFSENSEEPAVEFTHEIDEPETAEINFAEENLIEKSEEISADNYSLSRENEAENQFSATEIPEDHLHDAQTPNLEIEVYEENPSTENAETSAEESLFHAETPTQKLDEVYLENSDLHEPEVELIETHDEEIREFSANSESDFSLNVDDSEVYLLEDAQITTSYESNAGGEAQDNEEFHISSEAEKNAPETSELSLAEEKVGFSEAEPTISENVSANDYYGSYDQPMIEFSYNDWVDFAVSERTFEPEMEIAESHSAEPNETFEIQSAGSNEVVEKHFEAAESFPAMEAESESFVSEAQQENVNCPFCGFSNDARAIPCDSCRSILSLSDLEMLLAHQDADREVLAQTIEMMEAEKQMRDFSEDELCLLGIAHLNAKNLRKGLNSLQEASKLNPNDVVLSSKVNFLAIRLSEIEAQENKNQDNASVSRMIMVVDDSPTVRKLISGKLEKSGHTVITANDGIEALSKMNELTPDLILLDIAMPQMDGYQVCKMIRNNDATKDIPVVMISGKDGFFDKVRGKMAGSTGYITKPFGPETLMKTLETYIV